jgi:hypothetical protein
LTYSGKYKIKNRAKYRGDADTVVYRSHWEKLCFMWCDDNSEITEWSSEEVVVPYYFEVDKKYHRYFVDLKVTFNSGKTLLIEIKPDSQTRAPKRPDKSKRYINEAITFVKNQNKWEAANKFAKKKGWEFQIWTEHTLKSMGIMKEMKVIKPIKPFRKSVKKKR